MLLNTQTVLDGKNKNDGWMFKALRNEFHGTTIFFSLSFVIFLISSCVAEINIVDQLSHNILSLPNEKSKIVFCPRSLKWISEKKAITVHRN